MVPRNGKVIEFAGREVTVKELTVAEIKQVFDKLEACDLDRLDLLLDHEVPTCAVLLATGLDAAALDAATPSALLAVYDAVAEVNPIFAAAMRRLQRIGDAAAKEGPAPLSISPAP